MKKRTCDPRLAARLAREPLYSLASAWQVAESLGERAADTATHLRPARAAEARSDSPRGPLTSGGRGL